MNNYQKTIPETRNMFNTPMRSLIRLLAIITVLAGSFHFNSTVRAQINLLANPGAEAGSFSGWTKYNDAGYNFNTVTNIGSGATIPPHSGNYAFFVYGDYNYATGYNGMYQKSSAHAGQVFTADGWVYQLGTDAFSGGS